MRTCANYGGIADTTGTVCCHADCGECGGSGCNQRFGTDSTKESCCMSEIKDNGKMCGYETQTAPCYQETVGKRIFIFRHILLDAIALLFFIGCHIFLISS